MNFRNRVKSVFLIFGLWKKEYFEELGTISHGAVIKIVIPAKGAQNEIQI